MNKSVIVTGARGFIGRHTIKSLYTAGFEPIGLSHIDPTTWSLEQAVVGMEWDWCDLLNPVDVRAVMQRCKPEYLLHLAWDILPGYRTNPNNIDWMNASLNLIHQFANYGGRKAVIAGTCFDHNPDTLYGTCKRSLWNILHYANYANSLELSYGRPYYLYGPHEAEYRLIPTMINGLLDNKVVEMKSMAQQSMNLMYVQDVADAFVQALDTDIIGEFDIWSHDTPSIGTLSQLLTDLLDREESKWVFGDVCEMTKTPYDNRNAMKLKNTGKTSLIRGLTKTINWWEGQRLNKEGL